VVIEVTFYSFIFFENALNAIFSEFARLNIWIKGKSGLYDP
jgi:hypothetical protein